MFSGCFLLVMLAVLILVMVVLAMESIVHEWSGTVWLYYSLSFVTAVDFFYCSGSSLLKFYIC